MQKPIEMHSNFLRRAFLRDTGLGLGSVALASLMQPAANANLKSGLHHAARAKAVIFLHMVGAPSQLDLFDYKPKLVELSGQPCPEELLAGKRFAFIRGTPLMLGTKFRFQQHGQSGIELSELLPHLGSMVDEISLIKTVHTNEINHAPAQLFLQTGTGRFGRPSMGSWISYGLGSENSDLPAFVVMQSGATAGAGNSLWGSGFLPSVYQGTAFRNSGDPVLFLSNPPGFDTSRRRDSLNIINSLNQLQLETIGDPEIQTRIEQYELAFRMQASVPELTDLSQEPASVLEMYGAKAGKASFASQCLLARRLVERGVRFVQVLDSDWDHHGSLNEALPKKCKQVDQPIAALLRDLKQRGLLDDTLVVFGAEFGRTPMLQGDRTKDGRDHHKDAYCMWMAGGGTRGGYVHGKTDELGYNPVENPVHVHDLQATILHLLGIDHQRLTYRYQGRDFRLTDVAGKVVGDLIA